MKIRMHQMITSSMLNDPFLFEMRPGMIQCFVKFPYSPTQMFGNQLAKTIFENLRKIFGKYYEV
jgi:hypothetical protein